MTQAPETPDAARLLAQVSALEERLAVHERTVREQKAALAHSLEIQQEQARRLESFNADLLLSNVDLANEVVVRNRAEQRLAVQYAVVRILAESGSLPEALPRILRSVCEGLGWDLGIYWRLEADIERLRCLDLWHNPAMDFTAFEVVTRRTLFPPGVGLPGRVWSSREPAWIPDVVVDGNFPRATFAAECGLHGGFAFPLQWANQVIGVIEFFSRQVQPPDHDLLPIFAILGSQIGQFMEYRTAEQALRRLAADLARSNTDLEQFAFAASHDLQEPLRAIAGFAQLLQRHYAGKLDERADEYIRNVVEGVERMYALINDLLEYARVTRRGQPFQPSDFHQVVQQAVAQLKVAMEESGTKVVCLELPTVRADKGQMIRLFQNLIGNAVKYRARHAPEVRIAAEEKRDVHLFSVQDNGIGIDPQHLERIFVIFQRLHSREQYPGTGIGLAVCKRIVERHGGRIWAESMPGAGSTFFFTISKHLGEQP